MGNDLSTTPQASHSDHLERLSQAITREWLYDGRIVVYTLTDVRRESVDMWVNAFKADIMNWTVGRPFLVMHDFSSPGALATPYARTRAQEVVDVRPEITGRAALVLSGTIMNNLIHIFLNRQTAATPRIRKTFLSREQAIAWLLSEE